MDFDYCIIEEASQVIEPLIIGPLMKAKKFIMIGDYYQVKFDNFMKFIRKIIKSYNPL
jgi:superfamily I DNA and/or RNA helicase